MVKFPKYSLNKYNITEEMQRDLIAIKYWAISFIYIHHANKLQKTPLCAVTGTGSDALPQDQVLASLSRTPYFSAKM